MKKYHRHRFDVCVQLLGVIVGVNARHHGVQDGNCAHLISAETVEDDIVVLS